MGESKHTPGPWYVEHGNIRSEKEAGTIAKMVNQSASFAAQVAADARLIAAAPLMLEALREALAISCPYAKGPCECRSNGIHARWRAAIKAATGGET